MFDKSHTLCYIIAMDSQKLQYEFSEDKNRLLIKERGVSFEDIISAIENGGLIDTVKHSNTSKYPTQEVYLVEIDDYIYAVPFVQKDEQIIFLKTIFPSRKLTKKYLSGVEQ